MSLFQTLSDMIQAFKVSQAGARVALRSTRQVLKHGDRWGQCRPIFCCNIKVICGVNSCTVIPRLTNDPANEFFG